MDGVTLVVRDAFGPHWIAEIAPDGSLTCTCGFTADRYFWRYGTGTCPNKLRLEIPWPR